MGDGAMMFNEIVIQKEALDIVNDFDIKYSHYTDELYVMDSVESTLIFIISCCTCRTKSLIYSVRMSYSKT